MARFSFSFFTLFHLSLTIFRPEVPFKRRTSEYWVALRDSKIHITLPKVNKQHDQLGGGGRLPNKGRYGCAGPCIRYFRGQLLPRH